MSGPVEPDEGVVQKGESHEAPGPKHWSLKGGGVLDYEPHWLSGAEADLLLTELTEVLSWEERPIVVFGKEVMQPRLIAWAGELPYRYSGQELPPRAAPPALVALLERVQAATGVPFNHVVGNLYRDGQDHVSMHADNEPELGRCPVVASVSLGATRRFVVEQKGSRKKRNLSMHHGSLLIMGGSFQHKCRHGVPRQPNITEPRLNLTFRWLGGPPGWRQPPGEEGPPRLDPEA